MHKVKERDQYLQTDSINEGAVRNNMVPPTNETNTKERNDLINEMLHVNRERATSIRESGVGQLTRNPLQMLKIEKRHTMVTNTNQSKFNLTQTMHSRNKSSLSHFENKPVTLFTPSTTEIISEQPEESVS